MYDVTESVHNILMLYWWVVHESHCQIPHNVVIGKRVQIKKKKKKIGKG